MRSREDLHEVSLSMSNLLIFLGRFHEDFVKKIINEEKN